MLQNLRKIAKDGVAKITTFDMDSSELRVSMLPSKVDLCFIDGEDTNSAADRDFALCESALAAPGVIYFHDSEIVFQALDNILKCLRAAGRPFHAYNLPTSIFVIDLGMNIHEDDSITKFLSENHLGYHRKAAKYGPLSPLLQPLACPTAAQGISYIAKTARSLVAPVAL
jgi:hypothetical protein